MTEFRSLVFSPPPRDAVIVLRSRDGSPDRVTRLCDEPDYFLPVSVSWKPSGLMRAAEDFWRRDDFLL
jgi:hypothetical protein